MASKRVPLGENADYPSPTIDRVQGDKKPGLHHVPTSQAVFFTTRQALTSISLRLLMQRALICTFTVTSHLQSEGCSRDICQSTMELLILVLPLLNLVCEEK